MPEEHRPNRHPPEHTPEEWQRGEERLARYAHLEENIDDAFIAMDERWFVKAWNRGAERMYGVTADEALGRDAREAVSLEMSDEQLAEALQEIEEPGWLRVEQLQHGKDGTPLHVDSLTIAMRDEQGETTGYLTINRDITERKRAEEELRETSRWIEHILESITDAFYAVDREWRLTYINERALRYMQVFKNDNDLTREELLGKNVWEEFPEAVSTVFYDKYHEALREQKVVDLEEYYPPNDVWLEVHAYPSEEGLSFYWRDITERKEAEKEIEARAHKQAIVAELGLRALANDDLQSLMDDAAALVARTLYVEYSKITELLPGGEELLLRAGTGLEEELVGSATEPAGLGSQAGYTLLVNEPVIVEDLSTETRFRPPPLVHERGAVSGMTVVIAGREEPFGVLGSHSKSRRTFSEDDANFLQAVANVLATAIESEEAEERVEEGREAERTRIARDLHDEPLQDLTDALVQAQQIRQSISEDPQQTLRFRRLIATLDRIGPQLRGAVYDLRLEGEREKLFPELVESLVELHRGMAPESDIALEVHDGVLSGPLGERGRQLLRILGEALTNVRRHSGARTVRVSVGISEEKLWAEVEDDGRGFDVAQEEESEAAASASGGLGIRGMRERASALGGDLQIESDPETGTRVRFEMTLMPQREEPEGDVPVMLVDDHASIREALASTFEGEGFEVVGQAGSLAEARRILEEVQQPIDVAVLDLGLPDGYGADLIPELREKNPQAQALVLSATLERANIAWAVERGAAGVLNKTAHLDEVVEAVRRLRAGETLMPLEEVMELLRFAGSKRQEEYKARQAIEKLTPREKEVLQALAEGFSSQGIAERLNISVRTERNHMASILSKLGVHSQLQALVFAQRYGVVESP